MDNSVKLFCLGHSDDTKRAFPLKDTTIGELKELIKAKKLNAFSHIDADQLALWKADIPLDQFDQNVNGGELSPDSEIDEVFPDGVKKKRLHIIVVVQESKPSESFQQRMYTTLFFIFQCNHI